MNAVNEVKKYLDLSKEHFEVLKNKFREDEPSLTESEKTDNLSKLRKIFYYLCFYINIFLKKKKKLII